MQRIGFKTFLLFSINYIIGFGFIQTATNVISIGWLGMIVILICAFMAFAVSLSFIRGSSNFEGIGGSYVYAKQTFKPKMSFFVGWNQYIQSPLVGAATPLFLYQIIKDYLLSDYNLGPSWMWMIFSFLLFSVLFLISLLGFKKSSKFILIAGAAKWLILLITLFSALALFIKNPYFVDNMNIENVSISTFIAALITFYYSFGGIEGVAAMSTDVKDSKKSTSKVILYAFLFATGFYLIFYFILVGALSQRNELDASSKILQAAFGISGLVLFIIAMIFNKISATPGSILTASRGLTPLSQDGHLPAWISKQNKSGEYQNAMILDVCGRIFFMFWFMLVPLMANAEFNFTQIIDIIVLCMFGQYILNFYIIWRLAKENKIKKIPFLEKVVYLLTSITMAGFILVHFVPPILGVPYATTFEGNNSYIILLSQLGSYLLTMAIGYIMYFIQKKNKQKKAVI